MASSSSFCQPNYQVFLCFRGEDTRLNFTSHLLKALKDRGIEVFFDDKELKKGEEISPALLKAIVASKISIVILSKDYASSRSCLTELSKIIDCKHTEGQIVLPIFYHVNPSDVKKHGGSFRKSFDEHVINEQGEIKRWKLAFTEVGKLKGWHIQGCLSDRSEAEYIEEVVQVVLEKLNSKSSSCFKDQLVGIDDQKKKVISLLCIPQETTRRVGICGMGGIGKTTLAQAVYDEVSVQFDCCHFLQNVREKLGKQGMESLRNELLSKVFKYETHLGTPSIGSTSILDRLGSKRVFIVLDDVNEYGQIEDLGVQHFGPGSKIILTSRDKQVLKGVDAIHEVERLNYEYSLQLFSRFAFKQGQPIVDFRDLSNKFATYAGGLPLALKVLGGALYQKPRECWKSARDKLEEYPDQKIFNSLKISYDGLDALEQNIFLDIAFFFKGEDKEDVKKILDGCYKGALYGISNLVSKFLIDEYLQMHDLLREMGCEIVRQERSRLKSKDVYHVLKNNKGTESIKGISLDLSEVGVQFQLCPSTFDNMINLKMINFYNARFTGYKNPEEFKLLLSDQGLKSLPDELRFLHWECCPLKSFPSNFNPKNLVKLKLTYCNIGQLWDEDQNVMNLRVVHLENCKNLTRIQNLSQALNIRELSVISCPIIKFPEIPRNTKIILLRHTQIGEVPSSIGCLNKLESLALSGPRIQNLPTSIEKLDALSSLDLTDCPKITDFPSVPEKVEVLLLRRTAIEEVPSSISRLKNLKSFSVSYCKSLKSISYIPPCKRLYLHRCTSLKQVTSAFDDCSNLNPHAISKIVANALLASKVMAKLYAEELAEKVNGIDGHEGVNCCFPGNEIPSWFENRGTISFKIPKLGSTRCGYRGGFWGFVLCLVVNLKSPYAKNVNVRFMYQLKTKCGDYHDYESGYYLPILSAILMKNRNLVLIFFRKDLLQEDKQYEEASFRFDPQNDFIKVEKCGVHAFYYVRSNKRFKSVEDGVELALERSQPSSGSFLSLIQDDGNSCDPDMMQPNFPVDPNRLSLILGVNSACFVFVFFFVFFWVFYRE